MKKVLILGSTGSIGTQALEIIRNNEDKFSVAGLTCRSRVDELIAQAKVFKPKAVSVGNSEDAKRVRDALGAVLPLLEIYHGEVGLSEIAKMDCDIVLNSLMGISGLKPTYKAIESGRDIALANKETLVAGGELITSLCRNKRVRLIPVDSEHSAIFQCLEGNGGSACTNYFSQNSLSTGRQLRRILLTASGGPFRGRTLESLRGVTIQQALNHPNWKMGAKITIDSATMMNKGLEVIEAKWLFDASPADIVCQVHPVSRGHSMVEFHAGAVFGQRGRPDMKIPISLALNYPDRLKLGSNSLDFFTVGRSLTFEEPDRSVFRCIDIAYDAIKEGGAAPIVMNGANEELVSIFLRGEIGFLDISETIARVMEKLSLTPPRSIDEILEIDRIARIQARELLTS